MHIFKPRAWHLDGMLPKFKKSTKPRRIVGHVASGTFQSVYSFCRTKSHRLETLTQIRVFKKPYSLYFSLVSENQGSLQDLAPNQTHRILSFTSNSSRSKWKALKSRTTKMSTIDLYLLWVLQIARDCKAPLQVSAGCFNTNMLISTQKKIDHINIPQNPISAMG